MYPERFAVSVAAADAVGIAMAAAVVETAPLVARMDLQTVHSDYYMRKILRTIQQTLDYHSDI